MSAFPSVDLTTFDLAPAARQVRIAGDAVASAALELSKEAAYTTIGLGVLAFQRVQVRRREFEKSFGR